MADLYRKTSLERISNPDQLDKAITITSPMSWLALIGIALIFASVIVWSCLGTLPTTLSASGMICDPSDTCAVYSGCSGTVSSLLVKNGDKVNKGDAVAAVKTGIGEVKNICAPVSGVISDVLVEAAASEGEAENTVSVGQELFRITPDVTQSKKTVVLYVPLTDINTLTDISLKPGNVLVNPAGIDSQKYGHLLADIIYIGEYPVDVNNNAYYIVGESNNSSALFTSAVPVAAVVCEIKGSDGNFQWSGKKPDTEIGSGMIATAKIITAEEKPIYKLFNNLKDKLEG